ncbi:hypothetical protein NR798_26340 [Archangium gephyra]|uniref:GNAT family N-acetyltransferase n=1 Tax=Archangium gephyra TaxID=48 RepID=UPI0035D3F4A4
MEAIARLYNQGIEDRVATFETRPRTEDEVSRWFDGRHPVVLAEEEGRVVAFASTSAYQARECYGGISPLPPKCAIVPHAADSL